MGNWSAGGGGKEQVVSVEKNPVGSLNLEYWQPGKGMTEVLEAAMSGKKLTAPTHICGRELGVEAHLHKRRCQQQKCSLRQRKESTSRL